jgi:hypothetical protein
MPTWQAADMRCLNAISVLLEFQNSLPLLNFCRTRGSRHRVMRGMAHIGRLVKVGLRDVDHEVFEHRTSLLAPPRRPCRSWEQL